MLQGILSVEKGTDPVGRGAQCFHGWKSITDLPLRGHPQGCSVKQNLRGQRELQMATFPEWKLRPGRGGRVVLGTHSWTTSLGRNPDLCCCKKEGELLLCLKRQ